MWVVHTYVWGWATRNKVSSLITEQFYAQDYGIDPLVAKLMQSSFGSVWETGLGVLRRTTSGTAVSKLATEFLFFFAQRSRAQNTSKRNHISHTSPLPYKFRNFTRFQHGREVFRMVLNFDLTFLHIDSPLVKTCSSWISKMFVMKSSSTKISKEPMNASHNLCTMRSR